MKKNVKLKIFSTQKHDTNEIISFNVDGVLFKKADKYYIKYEESEEFGTANTKTTLKLEQNKIVLIRNNQNTTQMVFEKNTEHFTNYETVAGVCVLGIFTKNIENSITDYGGNLFFEYTINMQEQLLSQNTFKIDIITED